MTKEYAIQSLRDVLAKVDPQSADEKYREAAEIRDAKPAVVKMYQPVFKAANLDRLTDDTFRGFLLFRNNRHWGNLHRQGGMMTADMPKLREALKILLNENVDIQTRLNDLLPSTGGPKIKGLGRAVITAILQIASPDKYGVWNNTAEESMKRLGIWPDMPRGASFGERYVALNNVLLEMARQVGTDLWTLDMLWWRADPLLSPPQIVDEMETPPEVDQLPQSRCVDSIFGLEKHLQDFLVDNWQNIEGLHDWELLEEDGEIKGSYYNTHEVGEIDLLAKRREGNGWLVIELKKDQTSDATAGQVLRYMGWVRRNLANGTDVHGLIVCKSIDRRLQYALDGQPNITCMTYEISFNLNNVPQLEQM